MTDLNFPGIPVVLEGSRTHAIVAGDNTAYPYLMYLPKAGPGECRRPRRDRRS